MTAHAPSSSSLTSREIILASLDLITLKGWERLSLQDIADHLGASLKDIHSLFLSKAAVLEGIFHYFQQETLHRLPVMSPSLSEKDRLFDVLMTSFEAAAPHKEAIRHLSGEMYTSPCLLKEMVSNGFTALTWFLEAALLPPQGFLGVLQVNAFGLLYLKLLDTWLKDDTPDMAATLAALDTSLSKYMPYILNPSKAFTAFSDLF